MPSSGRSYKKVVSRLKDELRELWYALTRSRVKTDVDLTTCTFSEARRWFSENGFGFSATRVKDPEELRGFLLEGLTIPSVTFGSVLSAGIVQYLIANEEFANRNDIGYPLECDILFARDQRAYDAARNLYKQYLYNFRDKN